MEIRTLDSRITVVASSIDGVAGIGITLGGWDLQALEYIGGWNSQALDDHNWAGILLLFNSTSQ